MKKTHVFLLAAYALVTFVLLAGQRGCWHVFTTECRLLIANRSGHPVTVVSGHTGRIIDVANGADVLVPHGEGSLTVRSADGNAWYYPCVSLMPFFGSQLIEVRKYAIPWGGATFTLCLVLTPDGELLACDPRQEEESVVPLDLDEQPTGFPIIPSVPQPLKVNPATFDVVALVKQYDSNVIESVQEELKSLGVVCYFESTMVYPGIACPVYVARKDAAVARGILRESNRIDHKRVRVVEDDRPSIEDSGGNVNESGVFNG